MISTTGSLHKVFKDLNSYFKNSEKFDEIPPIDIWLGYYEIANFELLLFEDLKSKLFKDPVVLKVGAELIKIFKPRINYLKNDYELFKIWISQDQFSSIIVWLDNFDLENFEKK